jgi:hypothetical protein
MGHPHIMLMLGSKVIEIELVDVKNGVHSTPIL